MSQSQRPQLLSSWSNRAATKQNYVSVVPSSRPAVRHVMSRANGAARRPLKLKATRAHAQTTRDESDCRSDSWYRHFKNAHRARSKAAAVGPSIRPQGACIHECRSVNWERNSSFYFLHSPIMQRSGWPHQILLGEFSFPPS